jgi:hypothetical protein
MRGSLGYWINNKDDYNGFAQGFPPGRYGVSIADLAKRILAGNGLKIADVTNIYPPISTENLDDWAKSDWNLNTPGAAEGPPQQFMSEAFFSTLFENPAPAK